jgi:hypothetical protein
VNEGTQKSILECIFGVFTISGDAMRTLDKLLRKRLAECAEGVRLPLLCRRYQGLFAHCRRLLGFTPGMMKRVCSANKPRWSPLLVTRWRLGAAQL